MSERENVLLATMLGAAAGCVFGCLYLTERGRRVREQIEPLFDITIEELQRTRKTLEKARVAVDEGRRTVDDVWHSRSDASWNPTDFQRASS